LSEKQFVLLKIVIIIFAPILLIVVPTAYVENGPSICIFKNIFNFDCPGCGMMRAISCVFHLQFIKAFNYNKMIIIIFPLLTYIYIKYIIFLYRKLTTNDLS